MNFAVLASTNGTDLPSIFKNFNKWNILWKIVCWIVNKENCWAKIKLESENIPNFYISHKDKNREIFDKEVSKILIKYNVDYIICVWYMRILSKWFVKKWENKILNIHPALLPKFTWAHAIQDVLNSNEKETWVTVHFIDEWVDTGKIIMQKSCKISENETFESLKEKIQKIEQEIYPEVIEKISKWEI